MGSSSRCEHLGGSSLCDDTALVQQDQAIGPGRCQRQVVEHGQDPATPSSEVCGLPEYRGSYCEIEGGRGLIQQEICGVGAVELTEYPGHPDALPLASGELGPQPVVQVCGPDGPQSGAHSRRVISAGAMGKASEADHIRHGHRKGQHRLLSEYGPAPCEVWRGDEGPSIQHDPAAPGMQGPRHHA